MHLPKFFQNFVFIIAIAISVKPLFAQSLAQKLGYKDTDKLLIIHADDLGVAHSTNAASFEAMQHGVVNSGSIMVPTPWFFEVATYFKKNPHLDLGIHLTLTSEWRDYKWGPVSPIDKVKSLVNRYGYFYSSVDSFNMFAKPSEVELELTNQIEKCIKMGLDITHFDGHMGAIFSTAENMKIYLKLAKKYKVPVMYHPQMNAMFLKGKTPSTYPFPVDDIIGVAPEAYPDKMETYYSHKLDSLTTGVSVMIIHTAFDNDEMRAVCVDHPLWGSLWRQKDFNYFTGEEVNVVLKKNKIKLITWREIRDKVVRKSS
ncbi:MAG: hypothetical protein RLZZ546_2810 [Bacteroidota bacterium]